MHSVADRSAICRKEVNMSAKTKIVVLHMKELIYTGIFAILGILFVVLLVMMFLPNKEDSPQTDAPAETENPGSGTDAPNSASPTSNAVSRYIPGVYNTELVLGDQSLDVQVMVDRDSIISIGLVNLSDAITTMYPLLEPSIDSLSRQICEQQSLDNISYDADSKYTSLVLLEAIRNSLEKAQP